MATKKTRASKASTRSAPTSSGALLSSATDELLLAAQERGDESFETGRYLVTYKESATSSGIKSLKSRGLRVADARDYSGQAVTLADVGDAEALVFPEIGVALVSGPAMASKAMSVQDEATADGPVEAIEPEYFAFADESQYLRGFIRAATTIATDLGTTSIIDEFDEEAEVEVVGATWGLVKCKVPPSTRSGAGIKVAVLDTGMDLQHPDFAGRSITTKTFVGQPVQDLHSHGTHCIGTACGPKSPPGTTPRYGIAYASRIFVGKVLSNSGSGSTGGILAGINWAIANGCQVISMSLGSPVGPQTYYTAAGQAALSKGCLIVAAAGNSASTTGAPANSPTIMAIASLDPNLKPSWFSNYGKIQLAAPGRDVFSSVPRPKRYGIMSGTSMATPHVAGCAALWAQTSSTLRGMTLWRKLESTAKKLPLPASRVGRGLVQAP